MSPMTSGRKVERTLSLMRWTASSPASMLTPAASYVSPIRRDPSSSGRSRRSATAAGGLQVLAGFVGREEAAAEERLAGGADRRGVAPDTGERVVGLEHALGQRDGNGHRV